MSENPSEWARKEKETKEYLDSPEELDKKITKLAKWIQESKFMIGFTGAGVSTACGIPDFRSGPDTILETGTGKWAKESAVKHGIKYKESKTQVSIVEAMPSKTHMAFVELQKRGIMKGLISQNVDGLHRKSGFPQSKLAELHGNIYLEKCKTCGKSYLRDYYTRNSKKWNKHETGRKCIVKDCGGKLYDTIVNFTESLPSDELSKADKFSLKGDLCLTMGSSLTVKPACEYAGSFNKKKKRHVIVNLQKTSYSKKCDLHIFGKCDHVIVLLMKKLNIQIPKWKLTRYFTINLNNNIKNIINNNSNIKYNKSLIISGIEPDGKPCSIFKLLKLTHKNNKNNIQQIEGFEPKPIQYYINQELLLKKKVKIPKIKLIYTHNFGIITNDEQKEDNNNLELEMGFIKNYNEPNVIIHLNDYINLKNNKKQEYIIELKYDPITKNWEHNKIDSFKGLA